MARDCTVQDGARVYATGQEVTNSPHTERWGATRRGRTPPVSSNDFNLGTGWTIYRRAVTSLHRMESNGIDRTDREAAAY